MDLLSWRCSLNILERAVIACCAVTLAVANDLKPFTKAIIWREKPDWRGCFPYYLCLLLNIHYSTQAGIHVFILGCISVVLPKTEAHYWPEVIQDLERIEKLIQSIHIDATLYTESNLSCSVTAMSCFILELHVILQECKDKEIQETVENIIINANSSLSSRRNVTEGQCKQCEELEEKSIKEFVVTYKQIVQGFLGGK